MAAFIDLTGRRFGRLTVMYRTANRPAGQAKWVCKCECGKEIIAFALNLKKKNHTTSCGCRQIEIAITCGTKHGHCDTKSGKISKEWLAWRNMRNRCYDVKNSQYANYGGRGIRVCKRWLSSFSNFYKDMGDKPSIEHSLERKNVNKDYKPSNCKWGTEEEQANNRRNNKFIEYNGERLTQVQWERKLNMPLHSIYRRLKRGQVFEDIFNLYNQ